MASCASARVPGEVAVAISPNAAVMAVCAAWQDMEGVVCASLCVEASEIILFSKAIRKTEDEGRLNCIQFQSPARAWSFCDAAPQTLRRRR